MLDLFVAHDVDLRILTLPEGLDPFDYLLENGAEPFQAMIDTAPDAIAHKVLKETQGVDLVHDTHRANQALENILKTIARTPAALLSQSAAKKMRHDQLIMRLARQFQLVPTQVQQRLVEIRNSIRPISSQQPEFAVDERIDYAKLNRNETELLQILIQDPNLLDTAIERVVPDDFQPGVLKNLYSVMEDFSHDGKEVGYEQLLLELGDDSRLKALVDYLHDEATKKRLAAETSKSEFYTELDDQLESVIEMFTNRREASGVQARISQLHGGQLDADQETKALMDLFAKQQRIQRDRNTK